MVASGFSESRHEDPRTRTQAALPGTEEDADGVDQESGIETSATPARGATWPRELPEQIAAVRDAVSTSADEYSAEAVVKMFKGAKLDSIVDLLDGLAALGVVVTYELPEGRRWRAARFLG